MPCWKRAFTGTRDEASCAPPRAPHRMIPFPGQGLKSKGHGRLLSKALLWLSLLLCHEATETEATYLGGMKAVFLHGCSDHWTLHEQGTLALLAHMTVCVDVRLVLPGMWTAFSYGSPQGQQSELSLQGDGHVLSVLLGGRRYRFPGHLALKKWHHVCVTLDTPRSLLTLWVDNVPYRQNIDTTATPSLLDGELRLGCQTPVESTAKLELYLFRVWDDILHHDICENGNVVDWNLQEWNHHTVMYDATLPCGRHRVKRAASDGQTTVPSSVQSLISTFTPMSTSTSTTPLSTASSSTAPLQPVGTLKSSATSTSPPPTSSRSTTTLISLPITTSVPSLTSAITLTHTSTSTTSLPDTSISPPPTSSTSTLTPALLSVTTSAPSLTSAITLTHTSTSTTSLPDTSTSTIPPTGTFTSPPPTTSTTTLSTTLNMLPTDSPSTALLSTLTTVPSTSPSTFTAILTTTSSETPNTTSPNTVSTTTPSISLNTNFSATSTISPSPSQLPFTNTSSNTTMSLSPFTDTTSHNTTMSSSPFISTSPNTTMSLSPFTDTTSHNTTMSPSPFISTSPNTTISPSPFTDTTSPNTTMSPSPFTNITSPNTTTLPPALPTTPFPTTSEATTPANTSISEGSTSVSTSPFTNSTGVLVHSCSFSGLCANATFYWITLEVKATSVNITESNVTTELSQVFCGISSSTDITTTPTATPTNTTITTANTAVTSMSQSTTFSSASSLCNNAKENIYFQDINVSCIDKENISLTNCTVLLRLSKPVNTCLLIQQLNQTTGIQASILGSVDMLAQVHCPGVESSTPSGDIKICFPTSVGSGVCQNNGLVNITCERYANTVYVPLATYNPGNMSCPTSISTEQKTCSFSAYCSERAGYYTFKITTSYPETYLQTLIASTLNSSESSCNSSTISSGSQCSKNVSLSGLVQAVNVSCMTTELQTCQVYLKLAQRLTVCDVLNVISNVFPSTGKIHVSSPVSAMAIYSFQTGPTADLWNLPFSNENVSLNSSQICQVETQVMIIQFCNQGQNTFVLLNDSCSGSSSGLPTISPVPSNITVILINTTEASNTTANSTVSYNNSTLGGNSTNSTFAPGFATTIASNNNTSMFTAVSTTVSESEEEANGLLNMTSDVSALNSSQVEELVLKLEQLLSGPNVSLQLGGIAVNIVSNLLNASPSVLAASSTRLIEVVDTVGLKLVLPQATETILFTSLALAVSKVNGANFQQTSFSILDSNNVQVTSGTKLGRTAGSVLPQASITLPASLISNLTPEEQLQVSRVQFNFYQKSTLFVDPAPGNSSLNSGILGSSVSNMSISGLKDYVVFTLKNNKPIPKNFTPSCVFWNFSKNGGQGGWCSHGCHVQNFTDEETTCRCNHLTSFSVLLDISRQDPIDPKQAEILTYITYIGCGISAIFLSVTLLTYLAFEKLRKDIPSKILIHLCLALLLLNMVFLLDSWLALYPKAVGLCISTAFFLHYFLLASFTWMGLEAFHMYLALVKVFNTYVSRYMLKFGLIGWGVPLIVVIIVISISKDNYGLMSYGRLPDGSTDDICWIKNDVAFYITVVAYFCVIFLLNMAMFVVVLIQLCRIKRQNPHNSQHRNVWTEMRSVAGLTVLLGLTWGFAFFAWGPVNLAFMYLFSIFNSLQGFFIFVLHCAVKDVVRRQWRTYLCCGKLRLPENSDWSQTATQKAIRNRSRVMATSSRSSNSTESNNSSSTALFHPSDRIESVNGIGNPLEDGMITALEQPNEDVVLNEINSRHRFHRQQ